MKRKSNAPAILPCQGCHHWTKHRYERDDVDPTEEGALYAMYRCSECGTVRVWGPGGESSDEAHNRQKRESKARARARVAV